MSEIRFNRWSHQSGTGGIYQDSSGNIGIGTSTPTSILDIQGGSIKIGNDLLTSSGVSTFTSGLNVTGGNVGINETSPDRLLHITVGSDTALAKFENSASSGRAQVQYVNPHGDWVQGIEGGSTTGDFLTYTGDSKNIKLYTAGAVRQKIQGDGKIIVGGNANQTANRNLSVVAASGNSNNSEIGLQPTNSSGGYNPEVIIGTTADGTYGAHMFFTTRDTSGNRTERLRITSDGKIQINNTTPTLELNGTSSNATASANLLWNLRDGNSNDYDVVKITGQNNGNGGYGELTVQTAYNNTLKDRIVVSSAGISSFIGYTANTDVLRVHDGTVEINDSLNQNNWQLQITNSNNSFTTGNSLIRAEYTGTNSSSNIKVFSGYVTSESAETCYIAGNGQFHGRGITATRDSASILGKYHSTGGATIDLTALTSNTWTILEIFGFVNPNSGGSNYEDPLHMYVYNGRGYNGNVVQYIYTQHIAPPARDIFPTGSGHSGNIVDAVWYNGSTESDYCPSQSTGHYVRLKCYNYSSTYGSSFNVRYFIRR